MDLERKHSGKDLIAAVNRWDPGTKATSTFLNDCAASSDFMWAPPEQGSGKWKKYNDVHLLEFGIQCVLKAMSITRETSRQIIRRLRKDTAYHKSKSKKELDERLAGYMLVVKNSSYFESVRDFDSLSGVIKGKSGARASKVSLDAEGPASHALILVPQVILRGLVG